jgi:hypothetical protein
MRQQRRNDRVHKIENDAFEIYWSFFFWFFWYASKRTRFSRLNAQFLSIRFWRRSRWFNEWSSLLSKNEVFSSSWNIFDNRWVFRVIAFLNYWDKQSNLSLFIRSVIKSFLIWHLFRAITNVSVDTLNVASVITWLTVVNTLI